MADSIISPSDGDTSEEDEYTRIMSNNNPTMVETVDETSNSSNHDYTQLVSVSFTNASTVCKVPYMSIFLHYQNLTKYKSVIHHNSNVITLN